MKQEHFKKVIEINKEGKDYAIAGLIWLFLFLIILFTESYIKEFVSKNVMFAYGTIFGMSIIITFICFNEYNKLKKEYWVKE